MRTRIRNTALLAGAALIPVTALAASTAHAADPAAAPRACVDTMLFQAGGNGDGEGKVFDASNAKLPAGVGFTKISYSASIWPLPGQTVSLDDSVAEGVEKMTKEVKDFHAACPGSKITITGYSQGALVAGDTLKVFSDSGAVPHSQINGVLYADARRPGVNGGPGGVMTNLPSFMPGMTMRGPRPIENINVKTVCNKNDGICHSENPITNLLGFANGVVGYLMTDHQYAIDPHNEQGTGNFVIDQPPRIPHGAPLPIPIPPPYEWLNGDMPAAKAKVAEIRKLVAAALPAEQRDRLNEFPWLSVPTD
ncbi:PE-PPE domain-containing protein [Streptomyces sp. P38-E01]|uniref:PE-PPE domain-containing protein n=1 Tax=Streptomyces tardus TaxID=2780544 RepID=A0A949N8D2_9ACTN|nr:PE-PPE domain-containing protein [Streptomyces tardus]MBU7597813.1 PE-PPE domain-containing protein [Streptomyces tardus]